MTAGDAGVTIGPSREAPVNARRLYRSRTDRKLAGIAAGMADYLGLDPTVVRVLWVVSIFFFGFTILLYVILVFVIPNEPLPAGANAWPMWTPPGAAGPATAEAAGTTAAPPATVAPAATVEEAAPAEPAGTDPDAAAR